MSKIQENFASNMSFSKYVQRTLIRLNSLRFQRRKKNHWHVCDLRSAWWCQNRWAQTWLSVQKVELRFNSCLHLLLSLHKLWHARRRQCIESQSSSSWTECVCYLFNWFNCTDVCTSVTCTSVPVRSPHGSAVLRFPVDRPISIACYSYHSTPFPRSQEK